MIAVALMSSTSYVVQSRIDWPEIFADLATHGCSGNKAAAELGNTWSTVQRWRAGEVEPRHSKGNQILLLHSRYCGLDLTRVRLLDTDEVPDYPEGFSGA